MNKYLVVIDGTPECRIAAKFAAARAATVNALLTIIHVIEPPDVYEWAGVREVMESEAADKARMFVEGIAHELEDAYGLLPEVIIRAGNTQEELLKLFDQDASISRLVLAASSKGDPGPLIDFFTSKKVGKLPCPVLIIPGLLSDEQIASFA